MKTVKAKKTSPTSDDAEFQERLSSIIKDAAIEGAITIQAMIQDDKCSDASRLAAAKWAIERAAGKDHSTDDNENASFAFLMEIVRELRSSKQLDSVKQAPQLVASAPKIEGKTEAASKDEPKQEEKDWGKWIGSNLN